MKFISAITFLFLTVQLGRSQTYDSSRVQSDSKPVILKNVSAGKPKGLIYNKEFSIGGKLSTSGWGIFGDYTRRLNMDKKRVFYFELAFMKH